MHAFAATGGALLHDAETARANLGYLVDQVNATLTKLSDVSARAVNGATAGVLAGDRVVEKLKSDLRSLIAGPLTGFGATPVFLSDLGVQSQRDGSLRLTIVPEAYPGSYSYRGHCEVVRDKPGKRPKK